LGWFYKGLLRLHRRHTFLRSPSLSR
jgi:hypothetical protein